MKEYKVFKVNSLPTTPENNSVYYLEVDGAEKIFDLVVTGDTGNVVYRLDAVTEAELTTAIQTKFDQTFSGTVNDYVDGTGAIQTFPDVILQSEKGVAGGVAELGSDGKIPNTQIPNLAIGDIESFPTKTAMLSWDTTKEYSAERGDIAVVDDKGDGSPATFILQNEPSSVETNWVEFKTPNAPATNLSVGGRTTTKLDVESSTGTKATIPAATNSLAGLMTGAKHKDLEDLKAKINEGTNNQVFITDASGSANWVDQANLTTYLGASDRISVTGEGTLASPYKLDVKPLTIDTSHLKNESVTTAKIASGGNKKVLTTSTSGVVEWADQTELGMYWSEVEW